MYNDRECKLTTIIFYNDSVPVIPTISSVNRVTGQTATITWMQLTPDETRGTLTFLKLAYEPLRDGTECQQITTDTNNVLRISDNLMTQTTATITELDPIFQYCIAIQVGTAAGESEYSNAVLLSCKQY